MYPNVPIGIAAGLTAAIAMKMAAAAPNALGVPLIALLPLPIALAGLITNASTSFAAAGVAMLLLGVVTGVPAAFVFGLAAGLPASFLVHKALLHRDIGPGDTQWYPVGMIVVIAALIAAGVTAAGLVLATGLGSGIDKLEANPFAPPPEPADGGPP